MRIQVHGSKSRDTVQASFRDESAAFTTWPRSRTRRSTLSRQGDHLVRTFVGEERSGLFKMIGVMDPAPVEPAVAAVGPAVVEPVSAPSFGRTTSAIRAARTPEQDTIASQALYKERLARARRHNSSRKPKGVPCISNDIAASADSGVALECSICLSALHSQPCAFFEQKFCRTCPHVFHLACAAQVQVLGAASACPLCRAPFDAVRPLPSLHAEPARWFRCANLSGNGRVWTGTRTHGEPCGRLRAWLSRARVCPGGAALAPGGNAGAPRAVCPRARQVRAQV